MALWLIPGALRAETWESLTVAHFFIHYQTQEAGLARVLAQHADAMYRTIGADADYFPPRKIMVYLCPTPACFQQKQLQRDKLPDWTAGVAYPAFNRIVIRSALTRAEHGEIKPFDILQHEFAHIVLEQALAQRGGAPRWLSEGFAMYEAREWTLHGQRTIAEVALRDTFIPLALLTTAFPTEERAAHIAYAQSFSLVAFIINTVGQPAFHKLIRNLRDGLDTNTALIRSTGRDLTQLERDWQASLRQRASWPLYLIESGLFWFLAAVSVLLAYLVTVIKNRRVQEAWEAEEAARAAHGTNVAPEK